MLSRVGFVQGEGARSQIDAMREYARRRGKAGTEFLEGFRKSGAFKGGKLTEAGRERFAAIGSKTRIGSTVDKEGKVIREGMVGTTGDIFISKLTEAAELEERAANIDDPAMQAKMLDEARKKRAEGYQHGLGGMTPQEMEAMGEEVGGGFGRDIKGIAALEKKALRWGKSRDRARLGQQFGAMVGVDLSRKELRALRGKGKDVGDVAEALAEKAGLDEDAAADLKKAIQDASEGKKGSGMALAKLRGTVAESQREEKYRRAEQDDPAVRKMGELKDAIEAGFKGNLKVNVTNTEDFPGGEKSPEDPPGGSPRRKIDSDLRLKENVREIKDALEKVDQISGNEFDWKKSGEHDVGVIAQEVQHVVPEAVADRGDGYLAVNYFKLIPLLVQAVKELQADNFALQARVEELEEMVVP